MKADLHSHTIYSDGIYSVYDLVVMAKEKKNVYYGTGKRKASIAKVQLIPGKGKVTVNIKPKNFEGTAFGFEKEFTKEKMQELFRSLTDDDEKRKAIEKAARAMSAPEAKKTIADEIICDNNFYRDHGEGIINDGKIIYMAPNSFVVPSLFGAIRISAKSLHDSIVCLIFDIF